MLTILLALPEHFLSFHVLLPWDTGSRAAGLDTHRSASRKMIQDPPGTSTPHRPTPQGAQLEKGQSFSGLWICSHAQNTLTEISNSSHPDPQSFLIGTWSFVFCFVLFFLGNLLITQKAYRNKLWGGAQMVAFEMRGPGSPRFISIGDHWQEGGSIEPREWDTPTILMKEWE